MADGTSSESPEHRRLKQMALLWAHAAGYPIAAAEVSMPEYQVRVDVAAYRPARQLEERRDPERGKLRRLSIPSVGLTAVFECKASRPDYLRDSGSAERMRARLETLALRRNRHEEILRVHYPSIRTGDSLFPEYETLDYGRPGYEAYDRIMQEIRSLSDRLHAQTKFERLARCRAASLHYLVVEPEIFARHEVPAGWGVLVRRDDRLELVVRPLLQDVRECHRLALLHRIAMAGTRAVHAAHGVDPRGIRDADGADRSG